jgi:SAM-dependent methyltransferase
LKRTTWRISGKKLESVIDLGNLYVSYFYKTINKNAPRSSLEIGIGQESGLVQLMETPDQDYMYRQYWYKSGTNATMIRQLKEIVDVIPRWVRLKDGDVVLDIGCNDGTLLSHYPKDLKLVKAGIDPAKNLAEIAKKHCDLHAADYFNKETFLGLTGGKKAKVITAIAMFYDLEDPHKFVDDIVNSLDDSGIWMLQLSYTPLMIEQNAFDNICHEHIEYYTLLSMDHLFKKHDLKIIDVELNDVNSGSFRLVVTKKSNPLKETTLFYRDIGEYRYNSTIVFEKSKNYDSPEVYVKFMKKIQSLKEQTNDLFAKIAKEGKSVYGYGASTKGNTLLQYYGLTPNNIKAIAERQPQKYGLLTAGTWIPIINEDEMRKAKPDYLFILPWHFINEFVQREKKYLDSGGKFIIPLPELQII